MVCLVDAPDFTTNNYQQFEHKMVFLAHAIFATIWKTADISHQSQPPKKRSRASRASKLVAELDLTPEEEEEVAEVWSMYVDEEASEDVGEEVIATKDVRRVLM